MPTPNHALRVIRQQRGYSTRKLAEMAGVTAATVSRVETGKRALSTRTLLALADALGVEPELIDDISLDGAA